MVIIFLPYEIIIIKQIIRYLILVLFSIGNPPIDSTLNSRKFYRLTLIGYGPMEPMAPKLENILANAKMFDKSDIAESIVFLSRET